MPVRCCWVQIPFQDLLVNVILAVEHSLGGKPVGWRGTGPIFQRSLVWRILASAISSILQDVMGPDYNFSILCKPGQVFIWHQFVIVHCQQTKLCSHVSLFYFHTIICWHKHENIQMDWMPYTQAFYHQTCESWTIDRLMTTWNLLPTQLVSAIKMKKTQGKKPQTVVPLRISCNYLTVHIFCHVIINNEMMWTAAKLYKYNE